MKIVPDTSVIVDGRISEILEELEDKGVDIIIPEAVVSELEYQANLGRETGFDGLRELNALRKMAEESREKMAISFYGEAPTAEEIKKARIGMIDSLIRKAAIENKATLITSDRIQALVAEAKGIKVEYIGPKVKKIAPKIFDLFDSETMSVHLKENSPMLAKKGHVGRVKLTSIGEKLSREEIEEYAREIIEFSYSDSKSQIELERKGATVVQLGDHRIVIARPPFSDGLEITAVKPLVRTTLDDYDISKKLLDRLEKQAEGIFVAGSPGAGKTTFVQALAEFYLNKDKIVKTMEHPRDLQVPDVVTQYSPLEGSMENTADILVLVRPDYTIFDELRKTRDFEVFADMRLAGIGLVGVTHANKAIDAIQRLVGRVELGMIPHIVDTVIYIEAGRIKKVYELSMVVKVPHGMREADLARPVIEVRDFETTKPEYELYSYGEEVVVIPIQERAKKMIEQPGFSLTKKQIILKSKSHRDEPVSVFADNEFICRGRANGSGSIKIKRNTAHGRTLIAAMDSGKKITLS
ncbi:MAG: Flp pilus assembly complex ATPase component TadA [Candidatus Altiarchaeota archaeon]|nr:Flp pilus assembly complex ATPase component TadA [Candidatus Altiarchaeota archaeon]